MARERDWTPLFRWILLLGGLGSAWWTMGTGEMPFSMWLGIASIILSGALGMSLWLVGGALALFFLRYALFMLPICYILEQPSWMAWLLTLGFNLWESAPLWVAGLVGVWALRRREIPGWAMATLVASLHLSLAVWLPRPYSFSWGAPFLSRLPGGVWMFGADLLAALALGWVCLAARAIAIGNKTFNRTVAVALAPFVVLLACAATQEWWSGNIMGNPKKQSHDVILVQGGLPPFAGGFAATSERMMPPVILYSALRPDLILFPECMVQIGGDADLNTDLGRSKRAYAAAALGIAAPYSQVVFGVRDWSTNRLYFTDLIDKKPDVIWKDQAARVPFVDFWPKSLTKQVVQYGFKSQEQIQAPQKTPPITLLVRDEAAERGLKAVGKGLLCMSGEVRNPLLVDKIRSHPEYLVVMNSTIGGWLGAGEVRGSVLQANARAMELGVTLYRVGQLGGSGLFVPWQADAPDTEITQQFGPGIMRFKAKLPITRSATGFTSIFWIFLFVAPLFAVGSAGWIGHLLWKRRREIA